MLKALELNGFKSFADPTRFDFPDGITVVVGPNGSGKSNIVDAIKWVLGSQSAKSLRGGEMSDVIFKGSAASGRKPSNSAEATLVLDNSTRILGMDSDEVTVTRRVYRSGESEYLINNQACRLRDVKDLFRGTGVGVDAYSLIEQGKVDRMLQASPKDRRAIFEEAAGISRFKAKKVEAERRLARVNQNMLRLSDIVDEVHGRLNSIKSQASKAHRYREMVGRLGELRLQVGHAEYAELQSYELELLKKAADTELGKEAKQAEVSELETQAQQDRDEATKLQGELQALIEQQYAIENKRSGLLTQQRTLRERLAELTDERVIVTKQCESLQERASLTEEQIVARENDLAALRTAKIEHDTLVAAATLALDASEQRRLVIESDLERLRTELDDLRRQETAKQLGLENLRGRIDDLQFKLAKAEQECLAQREKLASFAAAKAEIESQFTNAEASLLAKEEELKAIRARVEKQRELLRNAQDHAIVLQGKRQSLHDRLDLLQQLDAENNGLGDGARKLIEYSKSKPQAPWNSIQGIVADLIEVDVHLAPLVDVSLAHLSEAIVLADGQIIDLLQKKKLQIEGRATLLRLDRMPSRRAGDRIQLDGLRGVIGRADRLVHFSEEHRPLVQFLLGTTWLVDSLETAIDLSHFRGSGLRFVTAACERIDTDGTIHIGTLQTLSGILTRRSEIHAVEDEDEKLVAAIAESAAAIGRLQQELDLQVAAEREYEKVVRSAQREVEQVRFELQSFHNEYSAIESLYATKTAEASALTADLEQRNFDVDNAEANISSLAMAILARQDEIDFLKSQQVEHTSKQSTASEHLSMQRIAAAKLEHQLESEQLMLTALLSDRDERAELVRQSTAKIADIDTKSAAANESISRIDVDLAQVDVEAKTQLEAKAACEATTQELVAKQLASEKALSTARNELNRLVAAIDECAAARLQNQQRLELLVQHYRDDHQIDLTVALADDIDLVGLDRAAANQEIAKLRSEIAAVGSVNMEALAELDELQSRYDSLHANYVDLESARENLLKVIDKIEAKSREMFMATLEAIRSNFQTLYRRSFGGGSADIILEDPNDVLNCGVEVIATPPGKIALSNSLLSGGEKALTAVALIMSIFQFRPSPFCILDEVDAPFDEANIGRFVNVLKDFLHMTKFIVVSHSKKTMTVANTIYGVTMQESGVSRQVSVRFEEVGDDGEILSEKKSRKAA